MKCIFFNYTSLILFRVDEDDQSLATSRNESFSSKITQALDLVKDHLTSGLIKQEKDQNQRIKNLKNISEALEKRNMILRKENETLKWLLDSKGISYEEYLQKDVD